MTILDEKQRSRKELREFGLVTGGMIAALFGAFFPWLLEREYPVWPWAVAGVLIVWGLIAPLSLKWPYRLWMGLGHLLGRITTPILMLVIFVVLITPIGLVMKIFGKSPLRDEFDEAVSYRVASKAASKESLERPF